MDRIKRILVGMLSVVALSLPIRAEYPIPTWESGQPLDGRHVTTRVVSVTTNSAVGISTNTNRMDLGCQFTAEGSSGIKLYWDIGTVVTSTGSKWVELGDYFTPNKPISWQGPVRFVTSSSTGTVICHELENPDY